MSQILTIATKELRAYFRSPVALIFVGLFLVATLFSFFTEGRFFARNIADIRPMFQWMPLLMVLLVALLTMRLWSEEQRTGTLEVLLTLPVKINRLVVGKFLASLGLVAVALVLTLGLPISVELLGDLDWGPVLGGYLGALLLAAAYLAIGLCISSATDNMLVAVLLTLISGATLYALGSETVAGMTDHRTAELLRGLGSGSRFASVQRGVIDLRDLVYYASLTVGFLYLNGVLLKVKRWSTGARTARRRSAAKLSVALVAANLLLLNVLLAPVRGARLDLTARGEYSVSEATEKLLSNLDAPLTIRGYFSGETHPLLAPLVPRIRDLISEYGVIGGERVRTEFLDPRQDKLAEKEANEVYGIKTVPFQSFGDYEQKVVNSYFTVLVKYGDQHKKLGFQDLIEVKVTGINKVEVKLRNIEYDLTRTIKKLVTGFQPLESVFARASGDVTLTAFVTPKTLPQNLKKLPEQLDKVAEGLVKRSGGKLSYKKVDPTAAEHEGLPEKLLRDYGFRPMPASLFSQEVFYLHLLLAVGDKKAAVYPAPGMGEAELKTELEAGFKRLLPGFLKTVGMVIPEPKAPPMNPMMRRRMPPRPRPEYQLLQRKLGENYSARKVDLKQGRVPGDVDVLLVVAPTDLDDKQRYAIDQFLMRGGAVVALTGRFAMDAKPGGGLSVKQRQSKLDELLETWGVKLRPKLMRDAQNQPFPIPVERQVMGLRVQEIQLLPYPFWVDVRASGMADGNPVVSGLPSVTLQWASPLELSKREGVKAEVLLRSSERSWLQGDTDVQPDCEKWGERCFEYPKPGGGGDRELKRRPLAVAASGTFVSAFKDKPSPIFEGEGGAEGKQASEEQQRKRKAGRTINKSPASARLVVVGSSDFVKDGVLQLSRHSGSDVYANNLQFVENLIDWSVADVDLLTIRSRGTYARTLEPTDQGTRQTYEIVNYGLVLLALGLIVAIAFGMRRGLKPMQLVGSDHGQGDEDSKRGAK